MSRPYTKQEILQKVTILEDGCWRPSRKLTNSGYAGDSVLSHITVYELWHGPLPRTSSGRKFQVDHKCRNKWCWSPFHLRPVTQATNGWLADIHKRGQMSKRQLRVARHMHKQVGQVTPREMM